MDVVGEEAQESIVECSQGGIGTAFGGLNLEEPDGSVDCQAEGTGMGGVVGGGEGEEGLSFPGADFLEDSRDAHLGGFVMSCLVGCTVVRYSMVGY